MATKEFFYEYYMFYLQSLVVLDMNKWNSATIHVGR